MTKNYGGRYVTITFAGAKHDDPMDNAFDAFLELADAFCPEGVDVVVSSGPLDEDMNPV